MKKVFVVRGFFYALIGATLLSGCTAPKSSEEIKDTPLVTPMSAENSSQVVLLGNQLIDALASHDYQIAKPILAPAFSAESDFEPEFNRFCERLQEVAGSMINYKELSVLNRSPFKVVIYEANFEQKIANGDINHNVILFAVTIGNIDNNLVILEFKPIF